MSKYICIQDTWVDGIFYKQGEPYRNFHDVVPCGTCNGTLEMDNPDPRGESKIACNKCGGTGREKPSHHFKEVSDNSPAKKAPVKPRSEPKPKKEKPEKKTRKSTRKKRGK